MRSRAQAAAAALVASALGCTMVPHYVRPAPPVEARFPAAPEAAQPGSAAADLGWRDVFGDPRLQAMVGLALEKNRDLRIATLNVEQVRAQYRIQRSFYFPEVVAAGTGSGTRTPADLSLSGAAATSQAWTVGGAVVGWELDLFGRVRSLSEAAFEQYLASDEARRAAHLALVAEVATQYLAERSLDDQVRLARSTLEALEKSLAITRRTTEVGRTSELDLRTAESQVEGGRFNLAFTEEARARAGNALVVLVGGPIPADLPAPMALDDQPVVADLPAGVPSDVLVRRPDVLAAEHALLAANAQIGAARAAFFPTVSLTGSAGTASAELSGLFLPGSEAWNFAPRIVLPIFMGGALRASLDVAEVRKSIQVALYERTIQQAFREVADALQSRDLVERALRAQAARVAAEERRFHLSELRYRSGLDSYLVLLTAQRDLYAAQAILIQARLASLTNRVELYRALGGGWNERTLGQAQGRRVVAQASGTQGASASPVTRPRSDPSAGSPRPAR